MRTPLPSGLSRSRSGLDSSESGNGRRTRCRDHWLGAPGARLPRDHASSGFFRTEEDALDRRERPPRHDPAGHSHRKGPPAGGRHRRPGDLLRARGRPAGAWSATATWRASAPRAASRWSSWSRRRTRRPRRASARASSTSRSWCPTAPSWRARSQRVASAGWRLTGASDHLVSEALYLRDPEGNGIEIYRDRPRDQWGHDGGELAMATLPLDLEGVLGELDAGERGAERRCRPARRWATCTSRWPTSRRPRASTTARSAST